MATTIPAGWLDRYAPGLRSLSPEERDVTTDFLFLWTMFEAHALESHTNTRRRGITDHITVAAEQWAVRGLLEANPFRREIAYFRIRYVDPAGKFTRHFQGRQLRRNNRPNLVKKVLTSNEAALNEVATVALIIVYRLRNNLFHGLKSLRELPEQRETFRYANTS